MLKLSASSFCCILPEMVMLWLKGHLAFQVLGWYSVDRGRTGVVQMISAALHAQTLQSDASDRIMDRSEGGPFSSFHIWKSPAWLMSLLERLSYEAFSDGLAPAVSARHLYFSPTDCNFALCTGLFDHFSTNFAPSIATVKPAAPSTGDCRLYPTHGVQSAV